MLYFSIFSPFFFSLRFFSLDFTLVYPISYLDHIIEGGYVRHIGGNLFLNLQQMGAIDHLGRDGV